MPSFFSGRLHPAKRTYADVIQVYARLFLNNMKKKNYLCSIALLTVGLLCAAESHAEESENQVITAISGTTLSGYVDTSMNWQFGDKKTSAGRVNDAADRQNGFNFNVAQIRFSKELDEESSVWSAGYAAALLMGPTASEMSYAGGNGDFALQHAYVDLRAPVGNGLDFRFGAFESLIGFEALETYDNPNYSRSYGSYLAHGQSVGGLASYEFDLNGWLLGLSAGIANAYDNPTSTSAPPIRRVFRTWEPQAWSSLNPPAFWRARSSTWRQSMVSRRTAIWTRPRIHSPTRPASISI